VSLSLSLLAALLLSQDAAVPSRSSRLVEKADGSVELTVTETDANGASTSSTYQAASSEEFRRSYPDLAKRHGIGPSLAVFDGLVPSPWSLLLRDWLRPPRPLGLQLSVLPEAMKAQLGVDGLLVVNLDVGGRGASAGLQRHDILVRLNGRPVGASSDFRASVRRLGNAGMELEVIRCGRSHTVTVERAPS
jgi:hypothetical protein